MIFKENFHDLYTCKYVRVFYADKNEYLSHGSVVIDIWHVYTDEMLLSIGIIRFG